MFLYMIWIHLYAINKIRGLGFFPNLYYSTQRVDSNFSSCIFNLLFLASVLQQGEFLTSLLIDESEKAKNVASELKLSQNVGPRRKAIDFYRLIFRSVLEYLNRSGWV